MKGYFITATDTDAGKTLVTTGLLQSLARQGYRTLGFKPVASGCQMTDQGLRNDDALRIIQASSIKRDYLEVNPFAFEPAIAPHIAAEQAGVEIRAETVVASIRALEHSADYVLVEGVGGWLVPLNTHQTVADLAQHLGYKVIMIVAMRLGCINHALLTAQAIERTGLEMAGWIANAGLQPEPMPYLQQNINSLQEKLTAPLLGCLPELTISHQHEVSDFISLDCLR